MKKVAENPDLPKWNGYANTSHDPILSSILSKLFNLILASRYVPPAFGYSYTVPICKLQDSRVKAVTADDFRGIAISPVISKVFEHCVQTNLVTF